MTLQRRHAPRPRARPLAVALAVLAAGLMAATTAPNAAAAARTLNVNPVTGGDANPATPSQPLKTLTKALALAQSGDSVKLAAGTYGPGTSGDQFPATGLAVRSGVTIAGATDSGFPAATLIGPGSGAALNLAGNATVRNLALGGSGFGVGLFAKQGTQTLSNLLLATATGRVAVIDGLQLSAGIVLRGTAQATLNAGASQANTTGSTLFVNGATGVAVGQQARFTMRGSQIRLAGSANHGVSVAEQARFTMDGGKITGAAPNCDTDANGITLRDASQATLKTGARLENVSGFGISLSSTAKATLTGATITRDATAACGRPSIDVRGSSTLTADGATLASTGGQNVVGISSADTATLALKNTDIHGHTGIGVDLNANETLTMDGGSIASNGIGIEARTPNDNTGKKKTPHITITGASLVSNTIAIQVDEPILKLRNSKVILNQTGIEVIGAVGGQPFGDSCFFACVNLGFGSDPGNNTLAANTDTSVRFRPNFDPIQNIAGLPALGNVWNPNAQGANGDGLYPTPLEVRVTGPTPNPLANGKNFALPLGSNTLIQVGPATTVGTFRLSPRTLTARPGRAASWKLAWTHPVSWKRLDQVVLRLDYRGTPVGKVVLDQDTRRLHASGRAIRLVPGRSAVSNGEGGGKRVTATLVLRIAKRYAGRTLVAKVAASDDNGTRQGFRTAGRVRVMAH
jgi:hypothetical protein